MALGFFIMEIRIHININWRDVQNMNVVNNVDMSCLRAPWQNGPYKNQNKERHKNSYNNMTQQTFRQFIFLCLSADFCVFKADFLFDVSFPLNDYRRLII